MPLFMLRHTRQGEHQKSGHLQQWYLSLSLSLSLPLALPHYLSLVHSLALSHYLFCQMTGTDCASLDPRCTERHITTATVDVMMQIYSRQDAALSKRRSDKSTTNTANDVRSQYLRRHHVHSPPSFKVDDDGHASSGGESVDTAVSRASRQKKERKLSWFFNSSFGRSIVDGEMPLMHSGGMHLTDSCHSFTLQLQVSTSLSMQNFFFQLQREATGA